MEKLKVLKQPIMFRVLYALLPILITSVYYFGWRVAILVVVSCLFSFLTEWIMVSQRNGKVTVACFVTAGLYSLSLPPTIPFWIAAVGAVVAILFGKEVFGGFGRNVFNPAIVGRAFVYVCFPVEMTSKFVPSFTKFPGGFIQWDFTSSVELPKYLVVNGIETLDAVSSATPLLALKQLNYMIEPVNLIIGNTAHIFSTAENNYVMSAGSCGEVCSIAILISLIYLLYTKTIKYRLFLGTIFGAIISNSILRFIFVAVGEVPTISFTLFSGALLYAAVFMVTEPVTAPKDEKSQWIYSVFIGMMIVLFRFKSVFAGGVAFSILIGNMLAPTLDIWYKKTKTK